MRPLITRRGSGAVSRGLTGATGMTGATGATGLTGPATLADDYIITVATDNSVNKFFIDSVAAPDLTLYRGFTYKFDFSTDLISPNSSFGIPQHFSFDEKTIGILLFSRQATVSSMISGLLLLP